MLCRYIYTPAGGAVFPLSRIFNQSHFNSVTPSPLTSFQFPLQPLVFFRLPVLLPFDVAVPGIATPNTNIIFAFFQLP